MPSPFCMRFAQLLLFYLETSDDAFLNFDADRYLWLSGELIYFCSQQLSWNILME